MKRTSKRVWSGLMAVAVAAAIVPLLGAPSASAAGVPQPGGASVRTPGGAVALNSGNSDTTFTLRLPAGASCGGDSADGGYRVQSYMVPASVDPATLTFNAAGPVPNTLGAGFRQPLYDTAGSPFVDAQTANASPSPGPGPIINIPDFNYGSAFVPGNIPPGAYNLGIACTLGPASATQMKEFWNVTKTFTTNVATGGTAQVSWGVGAVPNAPTLTAVTPGDATLTADFTPVSSAPATTGFTVTATPTVGAPVTATGAGSPITVPGLTNGTSYSVTVRSTNPIGDSAESNAISGTPNPARPPVTGLSAIPDSGSVALDWSYAGPAVTGFSVTSAPEAGTVVVDTPNTSALITGLTPGVVQTFTVTPLYASPPAGTPATIQAAANSAESLEQHLEVTRPVGALVLTQVCGAFGALDAEAASPGFPAGFLAAGAIAPAPGAGAPFLDWDEAQATGAEGTNPDSANFQGYPYPSDADGLSTAEYPTHCGIDLGKGKFVTSGSGAGQFFAASGRLNEVTVVDTRDTDEGWTVNGTMGTFSKPGASFSGNHLGWTPKMTSDTAAFDHDLDPGTADYSQAAAAGASVAPRSTGAAGMVAGQALGTAPVNSGLGIAIFNARLKLLIPVTALNGLYEGTLTFTTI